MEKGKGKGKGKGKQPAKFRFNGEELVPVRKYFLFEHPNVLNRQEADNEKIRRKYGILLISEGDDMPRPIDVLGELPFPDAGPYSMRKELVKRFKAPLPIQVQTWPAALQGRDIAGIAETGSGKTLAYVLPMLIHIHAQPELRPGDGPIGLILVPTRNLVSQVEATVSTYARTLPGIKCLSADCPEMMESGPEPHRRCEVMVATLGRLQHLLSSGKRNKMVPEQPQTNLDRCTFIVLDEADEILKQENGDQLASIIEEMREDRQVLLFSSTDITQSLGTQVLKNWPMQIIVGTQGGACKNIEQRFHRVPWVGGEGLEEVETNKLKLLGDRLEELKGDLSDDFKVLIFVNKKDSLATVVNYIREHCGIHQGSTESYDNDGTGACDAVLKRFSSFDGDIHILVATQVLGRGLDIPSIRFVINFDMPFKLVEYIHRIGRTGRGGEQGKSWTLLENHDLSRATELRGCLVDVGQRVPGFISSACEPKNWPFYNDCKAKHFAQQREAKAQQAAASEARREASGRSRQLDLAQTQDSQAPPSSSRLPHLVPPSVQYDKPFFEIKTMDGEQYQWCNLCNRYVDEGHVGSQRHTNNEGWYWQEEAAKATRIAITSRHLDTASGKWYLFCEETNESKWEEGVEPAPVVAQPLPSPRTRTEAAQTMGIAPRVPAVAPRRSDRVWNAEHCRWYYHDYATNASVWLTDEEEDEQLQPSVLEPRTGAARTAEITPRMPPVAPRRSDRAWNTEHCRWYIYDPITQASTWEEGEGSIVPPIVETRNTPGRTVPTPMGHSDRAVTNPRRHFNSEEKLFFWYNSITDTSKWEEKERVCPPGL